MKHLSYFFAGLLFGAGLILGGMTQPSKVIGFLDFFGNWDPSLALVMVGGILVNLVGYRVMKRQPHPLWALKFQVPDRKDIDGRLVVGAATFGVGWGMAGYCPGPGITSLASMTLEPLVFVASMATGMLLFGVVDSRAKVRQDAGRNPQQTPSSPEASRANLSRAREAT